MRRRTSKITNPMTPIGPVPFVGRQEALAELKQQLALVPLVSLHGALGSGKTRLVTELAPTLGAPCTVIECHPGDRASALRARAERALRLRARSARVVAERAGARARHRRHPAPARRRRRPACSCRCCSDRPRSVASSSSAATRCRRRSARRSPSSSCAASMSRRRASCGAVSRTASVKRTASTPAFSHARHPARAAPRVCARPLRRDRVGPRTARAAGARRARGTRDPAPASRARGRCRRSRPASTSRRR